MARRRVNKRVMFTAAATLGIVALGIPMAFAAEKAPTVEELLSDCHTRTDLCTFTPTSTRETIGASRQVSDAVYNCSPDSQSHSVSWSDTTHQSVNVNVQLDVNGGFLQIFTAAFQAKMDYAWENTKSSGEDYSMSVRPGWVGWIERAPALTEVTGDYELHYGRKKAGHYYWFARGVVHTGPSSTSRSVVLQQARPMNADEQKRCGASGKVLTADEAMDPAKAVTSKRVADAE